MLSLYKVLLGCLLFPASLLNKKTKLSQIDFITVMVEPMHPLHLRIQHAKKLEAKKSNYVSGNALSIAAIHVRWVTGQMPPWQW